MQFETTQEGLGSLTSDTLVVGLPTDWKASAPCCEIDTATGGWLSAAIESSDISTKRFKIHVKVRPEGLKVRFLILVGLGDTSSIDDGVAFRGAGAGAKAAAAYRVDRCSFAGFVPESTPTSTLERCQRAAVVGSIVGSQGQQLFRKEPGLFAPKCIVWKNLPEQVVQQASWIGESVNFTRYLVNLPPNYLYPESFVEAVAKELGPLGIVCEVWDESRLRKESCGALLGVAQASNFPPRLMIMRYQGGKVGEPAIGLVGKGVTFDSGGLSIKPPESMLTMKCDMAGAATVAGIMRGVGLLRPNRNVVGAVGLVENMIAGNAYRLGDVLTARSGKTIEVHNTDAEGRIVLADVLDVVSGLKPASIVDFATLTGACVVALGNDTAGIMSNNETLQNEILSQAKACGEYLWPLPMYDFFGEQIQGKVADLKNLGEGRWGGAITAAKFLEAFVGEGIPWCHLDIAGPAFYDSEKAWQDAGGSGVFVRTFIEWLCR